MIPQRQCNAGCREILEQNAGSRKGYDSSKSLTHVVLATEELQSHLKRSKKLIDLIEMKKATFIE